MVQRTIFEKLNPPREDGYPKVNEITRIKVRQYRVDFKDPNFDKPLKELETIYN